MSLYTIGDLHLSFGVNKPMNIFKGWENHDERIRSSWNALVSPDDTVIVCGDHSWGMTLEEAKPDFDFIQKLNGRKILLKGNHDYYWGTMRKLKDFTVQNGFDTIEFLYNNAYRIGDICVCGTRGWFYDDVTPDCEKIIAREAGRLRMSIEAGEALGGEKVAFLHYPPVNMEKSCPEIMNVLKEYGIKRCYFGHLHNEKNGRFADFEYDGIRFSLISSDFVGFVPKLVCVSST